MADEVNIERYSDGSQHVDLAPSASVEDTYVKSPQIDQIGSWPEDGEDPVTVVTDTKETLHTFVITGALTLIPSDPLTLAQKKSRLRYLYGFGSTTETWIKFTYDGDTYKVIMKRLTLTKHAGESYYEYIIELVEGLDYDDAP